MNGLLFLALRFGEVYWISSKGGHSELVRKNVSGICPLLPTNSNSRRNGEFSDLGCGTVCQGTIFYTCASTAIPGSSSVPIQIMAMPWACMFHAAALGCLWEYLLMDDEENMKGDKEPTWCCVLSEALQCFVGRLHAGGFGLIFH